jgi:hypothetical protein
MAAAMASSRRVVPASRLSDVRVIMRIVSFGGLL